jgi:hypothetical protein
MAVFTGTLTEAFTETLTGTFASMGTITSIIGTMTSFLAWDWALAIILMVAMATILIATVILIATIPMGTTA